MGQTNKHNLDRNLFHPCYLINIHTVHTKCLHVVDSEGDYKYIDGVPLQTTIKEGKRWSTLSGYLRPALGRRNFHVIVSAHVDKAC